VQKKTETAKRSTVAMHAIPIKASHLSKILILTDMAGTWRIFYSAAA